jgi:Protein of unknown function (DUF4065)
MMTAQLEHLSMTAKLILFFVLKTKGNITKTQLVKFLYLADLYSVKWLGRQITDLKWIRYLYGPYEEAIDRTLELMNGQQVEIENDSSKNYIIIRMGSTMPSIESLELPVMMQMLLDNIRYEWMGQSTKELLDFVYGTSPMVEAIEQNIDPEEKKPLDLFREQEKLHQELVL